MLVLECRARARVLECLLGRVLLLECSSCSLVPSCSCPSRARALVLVLVVLVAVLALALVVVFVIVLVFVVEDVYSY